MAAIEPSMRAQFSMKTKQVYPKHSPQTSDPQGTRNTPYGNAATYIVKPVSNRTSQFPEDHPIYPPPPPQDILLYPEQYGATVSRRKHAAPQGVFKGSSLYALYRLYEYIVLDKVFAPKVGAFDSLECANFR